MIVRGVIVRAIATALFGVAAWNALFWRKIGRSSSVRGSVAVLIPARDEETRLPGCLESLIPQLATEVLVYDDHSEDATAAVIDAFAARDSRVRRIAPLPLPHGWCGKNFACAQLSTHTHTDWLLFLDADVRLAPGAVARIASEAERRSLSLLSCWPGFQMHGFWEGVLMPMLNFLVFALFPAPLASIRNEPSLGVAHGACILVRRDIYQRLGGHALVKGEIFEDTRLAQMWRTRGERSLCLDGQDLVTLRMYSGFGEIWRGFRKNFYPAFRHRRSFWLFLALHAVVFLLPFFRRDRKVTALVLATRSILAARFGQPWWTVALHPVGEAVLIALALVSWWKFRSGQGVVWKRRAYLA